jgi:hypothetical protein
MKKANCEISIDLKGYNLHFLKLFSSAFITSVTIGDSPFCPTEGDLKFQNLSVKVKVDVYDLSPSKQTLIDIPLVSLKNHLK